MKVGSLFAGVGGFDIAAERAGMEVIWQSEHDKYSSKVLEHHWPDLNLGDIHDITNPPATDVLCGGFPCQDYSVAGKRDGLSGDRGALWWEFHRLIAEGRPRWIIGENVPGILSSRGGRDFATIIDSLTELGYRIAWRVLDAQYYGVAQRRKRVFIVGTTGRGSPAEVLALTEGLSGYPEPIREAQEEVAATLETRPTTDRLRSETGHIVTEAFNANQDPSVHEEKSPTIAAGDHSAPAIGIITARKVAFGEYNTDDNLASTIAARDYKDATDLIAFTQNQRDEVRDLNDVAGALAANPGVKQQTYIAFGSKDSGGDASDNLSPTLRAGNNVDSNINGGVPPAVAFATTVRRLTPLECERLQGFPDNWTNVENMSDTQRYKQMGNALAVPVAEWIMKRIADQE